MSDKYLDGWQVFRGMTDIKRGVFEGVTGNKRSDRYMKGNTLTVSQLTYFLLFSPCSNWLLPRLTCCRLRYVDYLNLHDSPPHLIHFHIFVSGSC